MDYSQVVSFWLKGSFILPPARPASVAHMKRSEMRGFSGSDLVLEQSATLPGWLLGGEFMARFRSAPFTNIHMSAILNEYAVIEILQRQLRLLP
jgi:hypothetical protein